MEELYTYRANLLANLSSLVEDLRNAAAAMPTEGWHTRVAPGEPTPHQTLSQLRSLEAQVFALRLRRILDEEQPTLSLFDDEGWMKAHYNPAEPIQDILDEFAQLRQEELSWLQELPPATWNRTARHPWWGVRTLQWWVELCLLTNRRYLQQLTGSYTM
jgi:hypothetical protein